MKFKNFLENDVNKKEFDFFLKGIKTNCSDFLKVNKPLFRGCNNKTFSIVPAVKDREPKDSVNDFFFNNIYNIGIELLTNVPLIRTKSLFCANKYLLAKTFGELSYVFPYNGSKYIFSNKIRDSFEDEEFHELTEKNTFWTIKNNKLKYFLINHKNLQIKHLSRAFDEKEINEFLNYFKELFKDDFLYQSVTNPSKIFEKKYSHEVLCYDAQKYYLINLNFISKYFKVDDNDQTNYYDLLYDILLKNINKL